MSVYSVLSRNLAKIKQLSLADPGNIPPPPPTLSLLIFRPNWGLEGRKKFFLRPALPSYLRVWITVTTPFSEGLDPPLTLIHVKRVFLNNIKCCLHDLQLQLKYLSFFGVQSTFSKKYTFGKCAMCPSYSDVRLIKSSLKGVKKGRNLSWSVVSGGFRRGA